MKRAIALLAIATTLALGGCVGAPAPETKIARLDEKLVGGSVMTITDEYGAVRLELSPDGKATATNIYGSRTLSTGYGTWMLTPEKDAVCLHGTVWWKSFPCWTFYGPDWAHATDVMSTYKGPNGGHIRVQMEKTGPV